MDLVPQQTGLPSEHEMMVFQTISKQAQESKLYNGYGGQAGIMMTMLAARELGIPPMLALNGGLANIQGKIEISARLMNAMMRRAGIKISVKESTEERCTLFGQRVEGDTATVTYTFAEAQKAGLVKASGGWVKCPKDMLFARAISRLARQLAPDVIGGCYVEGEIKASEAVPEVPEVDTIVVAVEDVEQLQDLVEGADKFTVLEYLDAVMKHFTWSQQEAVNNLLKDKQNFITKFEAWKKKRSS